MKEIFFHTNNLAIGYHQKGGGTRILQSKINLRLNQGEITCLLGPNGSGKSTLIRNLAGFQSAISGNIILDGRAIQLFTSTELARKISVVLTEQMLFGNMTAFDIVASGRAPYTGFLGRLNKQDIFAIEKAMFDTGIENLHARNYFELSDGERQKVMIAKSLVQETPIIFLDEPTAFLDFPSKVEILQLLRKASWEQNKAILLSTHDLHLAIRFADKIWLMGYEKPMKAGIPEDLILSGQLGDFFDREKIRFDIESGNFEFEAEPLGNILVRGNGIKCEWLKKALIRKGFQTNGNKMPLAEIEIENDNFKIKQHGKMANFKTIAETIDGIQKEKPEY